MTTKSSQTRLYERLPAVYRERDAGEGYQLRALLQLIEQQADIVGADIERLWDNLFIETCDDWVIPYIGDLVSNNLLHDGGRRDAPDTAGTLFLDLKGRDLRPGIAVRTRADVAKTIYYRRRKGTLPMLEELARDVTGWPAHAVEFFQRLVWTQNLNHLRLFSVECPDLRRIEPLDRMNGPFDGINHTVDVRAIAQQEGWYNIKNIGFFLWRLRNYPLAKVPARPAVEPRLSPAPSTRPWRYHFSPLGNPMPLFRAWRREGDEAGLATELHVPGPIRPAALYEDLERCRRDSVNKRTVVSDYYGEDNFFTIVRDRNPLPPHSILCKDLSQWDRPPANVTLKNENGELVTVEIEAAVDARLGRIAFPEHKEPRQGVEVTFHYGFGADLGGGPYNREKWLVRPELATKHYRVRERRRGVTPAGSLPDTYHSLTDALDIWNRDGCPNAVITILDSRTYVLPKKIKLNRERWLMIEAANQQRPLLQTSDAGLEIQVDVGLSEGADTRAAFTLSGVVVEGHVRVSGDLARLRLLHATLVPGRRLLADGTPATKEPSLIVDAGTSAASLKTRKTCLRVEIAYAITGPLCVPDHATGLWILDSIIDGLGDTAIAGGESGGEGRQPAPPTTLERVTILGHSLFQRLDLATETIFTDTVIAELQQVGCVRFSYVPHGSQTPRRYRCQPDLEVTTRMEATRQEVERGGRVYTNDEWKQLTTALRGEIAHWLVPGFTATRYGLPGYGQLRLSAPVQIRTGGEDGSEIGAFSHLKEPQRETNLRIRLGEYVPFGLDAGLIYVT